MKYVLAVVVVLVGLVVIMAVIGWLLPVGHRASRQATFPAPPEAVYATITGVQQYPAWRSKLKSVEMVSRPDKLSWREIGSDGTILFVMDEAVPARRVVTRIADDKLPFGGSWTFELTPAPAGTALRITEDGTVTNPIFRFMSRFVFGHAATITRYLEDLGRKLGRAGAVTE
jgi:hypothetical protein